MKYIPILLCRRVNVLFFTKLTKLFKYTHTIYAIIKAKLKLKYSTERRLPSSIMAFMIVKKPHLRLPTYGTSSPWRGASPEF